MNIVTVFDNQNIKISDSEFESIRLLLFEKTGIALSNRKMALVSGRLAKRLRYYGLCNFKQYYQLLSEQAFQGQEMQTFVNLLTTNETHFFREAPHFEFLEKQLLKSQSQRNIRIWSAAASSGEEAYSLAMLIANKFLKGHWEIVGTDINSEVLRIATKGIYPISVADKIPEHLLKKYCLRGIGQNENCFMIDSYIKQHVNFQQANLVEKLPDIGQFDIILLRNVMIYFNNETKQKIVEQMLPKLKQGGYFIVGHSESLNFTRTGLELIQPSVYRKI